MHSKKNLNKISLMQIILCEMEKLEFKTIFFSYQFHTIWKSSR